MSTNAASRKHIFTASRPAKPLPKIIAGLIIIPAASLLAVPIEISTDSPPSSLDNRNSNFQVLRSSEISPRESLLEVERKATHTELETELLAVKEKKLADRVARLKLLLKRGYASRPELDAVVLEFQDLSDRLKTQEQFRKFLDGIQSIFTADSFIDPPRNPEDSPPMFHLQIPGLSLRVGTIDLFTVRMEARSDTSLEIAKYIETQFSQKLAAPHKGVCSNYFQQQLDRTQNIPSVLPGELIQSRYYVSYFEKKQKVVNHEFAQEWHKGKRIGQFDAFLAKRENGETARPLSYRGSQSSFWLFGDGEAVAAPASEISATSIDLLKRKALSVHDETRAYTALRSAQERLQKFRRLQALGYSNPAEVRQAKILVDIAELELKEVQAKQMVSRKELEQLRHAITESPDVEMVDSIPGKVAGKMDSVDRWLNWLAEGPATDAAELLRFIDLVEAKYKAETEIGVAKRRVGHASNQMALYRKIPSVLRSEIEARQAVLDAEWADYLEALEVRGTAAAKLEQWACRNFRPRARASATEQTLTKVIQAGRTVNRARAEVAGIEIARCQMKNLYDRDYLNRLRLVQSKGAATNYEVQRARNEAQRSRGAILTAQRKQLIIDHQLHFLDTLYESGSISYGKEGMEITRFQPEALESLKQLAVLMDGVDEGKIIQCEADLADNEALAVELKRLVRHGHGSPVELERANLTRKQIENRLAVEQARKEVASQAVNVVQTLEFVPETPQKLAPPVN